MFCKKLFFSIAILGILSFSDDYAVLHLQEEDLREYQALMRQAKTQPSKESIQNILESIPDPEI